MAVDRDYWMKLAGERQTEIEQLRLELEWWKQQPHENCDSKCDYGKRGDPKGCDCGRAEWHAKRPAHLTSVNG